MINHYRTLFINDRWQQSDKYVDPEFRAVELPPKIKAAHRLLLPDNIAPGILNALVDSYIVGLHQGEFAEDMYKPDPRITYDIGMTGLVPPELVSSYGSYPKLFVERLPADTIFGAGKYADVYYQHSTFYERFAASLLGMLQYIDRLRS